MATPHPNITSHRASASLRASLAHPDGAAQRLTAAEDRATGQQERPQLPEMCVAQDMAINPLVTARGALDTLREAGEEHLGVVQDLWDISGKDQRQTKAGTKVVYGEKSVVK